MVPHMPHGDGGGAQEEREDVAMPQENGAPHIELEGVEQPT